ncbi:MAG: Fic family protein [Campylobacterota bacterium]|nr:Fic family protein [Campylobacterota bacterium]
MSSGYTPPYTITTKAVNLISQISEGLTRLEFGTPQVVTPMLRKKNRIKTLAGTLEIEGNYLGEEKITAILDGKRVLGTHLELAEVAGAIKAYENIENYKYDEINDLLEVHQLLMNGILTTAGNFRRVNVGVGSKDGVSHVAPPYDRVPELMHDLFEWLKNSDEHPLIKSCVFHYEFEFIHPFSDGNGRIGRLWQSVILINYNQLFTSLPTESIVRDHQERYYDVLEKSGELGESTPFVEFMLEMILEAINMVGNRVGNEVGNLTQNQLLIVEQMKKDQKVSAKTLSEHVGISARKIEENIAKLKKMEIIERVGGTRGHWEVKRQYDK